MHSTPAKREPQWSYRRGQAASEIWAHMNAEAVDAVVPNRVSDAHGPARQPTQGFGRIMFSPVRNAGAA